MGEMLIKDGVRYTTHKYANEDELEKIVIEHYEDVFGKDSIFLTKQKIKTRSGIGTIPDGFVLSMDDNKWYIIEVELDSHPLYEHIVPQITKFNSAMKNPSSKKKIVKAFYDEIKEDSTKSLKLQDKNIKELYKFISETLDTNPEIIIAINSKTDELDEVCDGLPFPSTIIEFKTFEKEKEGLDEHIHLFKPIYIKGEKKEVEGERGRTAVKGSVIDLIQAGLIKSGFMIYGKYKGKKLKGKIMSNGKIKITKDGTIWNSLSKAAVHLTECSQNGWWWWKYKDENGREHMIKELREKLRKSS